MSTDPPIIALHHLFYKFPDTQNYVLKDISFAMNKGEVIGIMGSNGAGKTTLIKTLNGLIRPTEGKLFFRGEDTTSKTTAVLSRKIGLVFQNPNHQLFSNTVEDEMKFSLKNFEYTKEEKEEIIDQMLISFNLNKYKNRSPFSLSGGEMKKLSIASIICRDPEILVFDEPTLGQDAKSLRFFIDLLNKEKAKEKSIIIVTHNVEFALEHIPRILLMKKGELIADGPTLKVLNNPILVREASLTFSQVNKLKIVLEKNGIDVPKDISLKEEMVHFLESYLK